MYVSIIEGMLYQSKLSYTKGDKWVNDQSLFLSLSIFWYVGRKTNDYSDNQYCKKGNGRIKRTSDHNKS